MHGPKRSHVNWVSGNVVDLWERLANEKDLLVELGSDQTSSTTHTMVVTTRFSCFQGGKAGMVADPPRFKALVQESLRRHVTTINKLTARGMKFWDYGNSFLLEASRAGADVALRRKRWKNVSLSELCPRHHGRHFLWGLGRFEGMYKWACLGPVIDGQNSRNCDERHPYSCSTPRSCAAGR